MDGVVEWMLNKFNAFNMIGKQTPPGEHQPGITDP